MHSRLVVVKVIVQTTRVGGHPPISKHQEELRIQSEGEYS